MFAIASAHTRALMQTPARTLPLTTISDPSSVIRHGIDGTRIAIPRWDLHNYFLAPTLEPVSYQVTFIQLHWYVTPPILGGTPSNSALQRKLLYRSVFGVFARDQSM